MMMNELMNRNFVDSFFNDFARPVRHFPMDRCLSMKTDIREKENGFELKIDLPGIRKEDVKAELKDGYMTVSAHTHREHDNNQEDRGHFVLKERSFGFGKRSFYVGDQIKEEDIQAKFEDGVLNILIPKKDAQEAEEKKYIEIL